MSERRSTRSRIVEVGRNAAHQQSQRTSPRNGNAVILEEPTPAHPIRRFRVSLFVILLGECALVAGVFITLISVVTVRTNATTKKLVEERIAADLIYSRAAILDPINNAESMLMATRLRYISISKEVGYSICNEDDGDLLASRLFWRDALSTVYNFAPLVGWVYAIHTSNKWYHPVTGDRRISQCSTSTQYMFTDVNGIIRTSYGPVTVPQTDTFAGVDSFLDNITDYRYEGYVLAGLEHTDFGWWPYLWIEPSTGKAHLFIGGFAPMYLNRTLANGTVETYQPDLTVPKANKKDTTQSVVSTICTDLYMTGVTELVESINPQTTGAHTSLYDLGTRTLMSTTVDGVSLMIGTDMYAAGKGSSALLNEAFNAINPQKGIVDDKTVRIVYSNGRIVSAIHITTTSDIDFVIIQSTPSDYYFNDVDVLRTLMITLGVCSAIIVVAVCIVMVIAIRRNLSEIQEGMLLAAVMKNDRVKPSQSIMSEIDDLCGAFARMNAKLGAARAFMPQSMLMDTDTAGEDDDEGDAEQLKALTGDISESDGGMNHKRGGNHSRSHSQSDSTLFTNEFQGTVANSKDASKWQGATLTTKRVTVLSINTRGFHRRANDGVVAGALSSELTATVQAMCTQQRGVIDSFHGDHFVLSFNAAKHNAQGPQLAVQCGLDIASALSVGSASKVYSLAMGVSAGRAMVGHLGSTDLKRFSIVGKAYSRAMALERLCKQVADEDESRFYPLAVGGVLSTTTNLLVDDSVVPNVEHLYFVQLLGRVVGLKTTTTSVEKSTPQPASNPAASDVVANPLSATAAAKSSSNARDFFYAVRGSSRANDGARGDGDEWLYEVKQETRGSGYDHVLPVVNEAMLQLLLELRLTITSEEDVAACAAAVKSFESAINEIHHVKDVADHNGDSASLPIGTQWGEVALQAAHCIIDGACNLGGAGGVNRSSSSAASTMAPLAMEKLLRQLMVRE